MEIVLCFVWSILFFVLAVDCWHLARYFHFLAKKYFYEAKIEFLKLENSILESKIEQQRNEEEDNE